MVDGDVAGIALEGQELSSVSTKQLSQLLHLLDQTGLVPCTRHTESKVLLVNSALDRIKFI